ncbi:MAG: BTAD domain-containing putative transcriptional regulator [Thermoleophilaceae bacterium]
MPGPARIARPALAARLSSALDAGSLLLVAGAGYGKTMALQEALDARDQGAAWISLTEAERDPGRLLLCLLAALRRTVPGAVDVLGESIVAGLEPVDVPGAGRELVGELGRLLVDPLTIVLDDAEHLAGAPAAAPLVSDLLAAPELRIAVAARRPLELQVAKLRATGRLDSLGAAELAFSPAECAELLSARRGREPSADEVEAVMAATEGWPLGIALSALSEGGAQLDPGSRTSLFAFLAEEVVDRLDEPARRALIDSSVPEQLDKATAEALELPEGFAERVERQGLFLRALDPNRTRFAYHPLFRDFLLGRLAEERPAERRRELHARVAPALAAAGRVDEAIEHLVEAERFSDAVAAIGAEGQLLMRTAPESVRPWLERMPPEVRAEPGARLLEGQLELAAGRHESAVESLRAAADGLGGSDAARKWLARLALADALVSVGEFEEVAGLAEGFDAPEAQPAFAAAPAVALLAAMALAMRGEAERGRELSRRALAQPAAAGLAPLELLVVAYLDTPTGRIDDVLRRALEAVAELERADPLNRLAYVMGAVALLFGEQGYDDEAIDWWGRAAAVADRSGLGAWVARFAHSYPAYTHARAGRLSDAEAELARADRGAAGAGWREWKVDAARAAVAALRGDAGEATAAVDRALVRVSRAPVVDRYWATTDLAPVLAEVGAGVTARALVDEALALVDERYPGAAGRYGRARLLAQRAWLVRGEGDEAGSRRDLARFWEEAGENRAHLVRREWPRLEPLLWAALEPGDEASSAPLDAGEVVMAIEGGWPGGAALLPFTRHPSAAVRRAAVGPAAASGHPEGIERLAELTGDPDAGVAAAARAAEAQVARTPPPLVFTLLGSFELRRGTWPVDDAAWVRRTAQRVVRFLLLHRDRAVTEDLLLEALWPDKEPPAARRALQVAVSCARAVLDAPGAERSAIEFAERTYRLSLSERDVVDADEFEAAAAAALSETGPERLTLLDAAERLWSGEPLPEERYSDWAVAWRERLAERRAELLAGLADTHRAAGDEPAATQAARKLVELDPLDEGGHRSLMTAYARAGRRSHALRQYLECRRRLVDGLGIEPSEETSELQRRILAGEPV